MEWINSNAGLLVLIGVVLNSVYFYISHQQNRKLRQQNLKQFKASQQLTGYIGKKMVVKKPPPEWEDKPYPKRKERTTKTPEETYIDCLIGSVNFPI